MVSPKTLNQYTATIGIETHVQLKTRTKLFSAVSNDARDAAPNTLISHIDLGMPGALPVLNKEAVHLAVRAAFALRTKPQNFSKFDRKHYFYPDLPKGYQITQFDQPIILGGEVNIMIDGQPRAVRITRAHLEEDAGKSSHPEGKDYSLVDLNRAGTPLLEIVSEPDMHSAQEAKAYARELWLLMRYSGVSDADLYHGNMRFDVNVSVSKSDTLGIRSETKNLNSFRSVEKAVDYEINRQIELLERGEPVVQETRGWDDAKQKTVSQRTKEEAHDYRYFPEPDLPPVVLDDAMISKVETEMPALPNDFRRELAKLGLDPAAVETLIDSPSQVTFVKSILDNYSAEHAKRIANWFVNVASEDSKQTATDHLDMESAVKLSEMVQGNDLSSSAAKEIWLELAEKGGDPQAIAERRKLLQVSDPGTLEAIVQKVIADNPQAAEDVKKGEMKAIGFLVGQVMKDSQGQANPSLAQKIIREKLGL